MRSSKTREQQSKYYEVSDFFEYLVDVWNYGNFNMFRKLYKELSRKERIKFIQFLADNYCSETNCSILRTIIGV